MCMMYQITLKFHLARIFNKIVDEIGSADAIEKIHHQCLDQLQTELTQAGWLAEVLRVGSLLEHDFEQLITWNWTPQRYSLVRCVRTIIAI